MAHIPCIGAIVFDEQGRLLLVKRANPPAQGKWSLPGGRREPGETSESGVVREVREETGLAVTVVREVGTIERDAPSGDTYVIRDFLCALSTDATDATDATPVAADDASDAGFFALTEVIDLPTSEGLLEALRDWDLIPGSVR